MLGNYDPLKVGALLLVEIIKQYPALLTFDELAPRVIRDPHDSKEIKAAGKALRDLSASGLIRYRDDDKALEPTQAALHAHDLLTGCS